MKLQFAILTFLFTVSSLTAQVITDQKQFSDKYGSNLSSNGRYTETTTKLNDSITQVIFTDNRKDRLIWKKSYKNDNPTGTWEYYKRGKLNRTEDYNFELTYGTEGYYNIPNPKELKEKEELSLPQVNGIDMQSGLMEYVRVNFRYPNEAKELGIQGQVIAEFIIGKDKKIRQIKIIKGVSYWLDLELYKLVNNIPITAPATFNGDIIDLAFKFPITFRLQ